MLKDPNAIVYRMFIYLKTVEFTKKLFLLMVRDNKESRDEYWNTD